MTTSIGEANTSPELNFIFAPMKQDGTLKKVIAVATLVFLTIITAGFWLIPFMIYGTLEGRIYPAPPKENSDVPVIPFEENPQFASILN